MSTPRAHRARRRSALACLALACFAQCRTADSTAIDAPTTSRPRASPFELPRDVDARVDAIFRLKGTGPPGGDPAWVGMDELPVEPILLPYSRSPEQLRVLAAQTMQLLGGNDHRLSQRRIQGILLALELVPWMSRSDHAALEARLRDVFAAGVASDGRLGERLLALQLWVRFANNGQPLDALLDAMARDELTTQVMASHIVRWAANTTADPRALVDWIARVHYGAMFARYLPGHLAASSADNVVRDFAFAQAWCCKRLKAIPRSAATAYEVLARGGTSALFVAFDSLCDAHELPADLISRTVASMCELPSRDERVVGFAALALSAFEADLRGSVRADAGRWLESAVSRLSRRMLPTDLSRARMVVETLCSDP